MAISVRDTGIGMTRDEVAAAFDAFRAPAPSVAEGAGDGATGGTGLGLPLTRALAAANGAALHVQSTKGRGPWSSSWCRRTSSSGTDPGRFGAPAAGPCPARRRARKLRAPAEPQMPEFHDDRDELDPAARERGLFDRLPAVIAAALRAPA